MKKIFLIISLFYVLNISGQLINKFEIGLSVGIANTSTYYSNGKEKSFKEDPKFSSTPSKSFSSSLDINYSISKNVKFGTGLFFTQRNYVISSHQKYHFLHGIDPKKSSTIYTYIEQSHTNNSLMIPFQFINHFNISKKFSFGYSLAVLCEFFQKSSFKVQKKVTYDSDYDQYYTDYSVESIDNESVYKGNNIIFEANVAMFLRYKLDEHFSFIMNCNRIFNPKESYIYYFRKEKMFYNSYFGLNLGLIYKFNKKIKA